MPEQAIVDGVVFRTIRWQVTNAKRAAEKLAQMVQPVPERRHAIAVVVAAISEQQNGAGRVVTLLAQALPPATNRVASQLARACPLRQVNQRFVRRHFIDAVGNGLPPIGTGKS